jgi:hypothetical protein
MVDALLPSKQMVSGVAEHPTDPDLPDNQ